MKFVNWRKFWLVFMLTQVCLLMVGCTAQWLSAVGSLLPLIQTMVSTIAAFVAALNGKTVSAAFVAAVQKIESDVANEIANVQALIAQFKASASTGLLGQIQAVLNGIVQNLGTILADASITDTATVAKLTQLVGLAVAGVQAILALIPIVSAKLSRGATKAELDAEDKVAAASINSTEKAVRETYVAIVTAHTTSADVNSALDGLPRSI